MVHKSVIETGLKLPRSGFVHHHLTGFSPTGDISWLFMNNDALQNLRLLQRSGRYQGSEKPPMCENNHNRPNLAGITVFVVRWGCPKHIGNNFVGFDNWMYLYINTR